MTNIEKFKEVFGISPDKIWDRKWFKELYKGEEGRTNGDEFTRIFGKLNREMFAALWWCGEYIGTAVEYPWDTGFEA